MKLTILGSGTSTGVPLVGCFCKVCSSKERRDHRRRASILIQNKKDNILVDTGPDVRAQILEHKLAWLDCVLYTHYHFDHMGGLNDLRPFSFQKQKPLMCLCNQQTRDEIKRLYPYVFTKDIPGQVDLVIQTYAFDHSEIYKAFMIGDVSIQPIRLIHVPPIQMECVGFVFNRKVGYLTDFKVILPEYEDFLYGLEILILGSPLYKKHPTHISIPEAFELITKYKPKQGIISHLGHGLSHEELAKKFSDNIIPAYDGLSFQLN